VARLDEHADTPDKGAVNIDGQDWTLYELRETVARNIAYEIRETVRLGNITKRDAAILLACHGASPFTIERHSRAIAAMLRTLRYEAGKFSAFI